MRTLLIFILLAMSLALACLTLVINNLLAYLRGRCWKCEGKGTIIVRGERIPNEELSHSDFGEYLVEGTHFYRAKTIVCPRCNGTGLK